ncbi:MAG: hypothetical protein M9894_06605 [Planctomycetes bacterium]|nr:hypothetical protein [Planctomycetota bacterium]
MELEHGATLAAAIEGLIAAKAEHRKILQEVAADPGMTPATRQTLIDHLWVEEDEHVQRIAALARGAGTTPASRGFTVGSLREEPAPAPPLGPLR